MFLKKVTMITILITTGCSIYGADGKNETSDVNNASNKSSKNSQSNQGSFYARFTENLSKKMQPQTAQPSLDTSLAAPSSEVPSETSDGIDLSEPSNDSNSPSYLNQFISGAKTTASAIYHAPGALLQTASTGYHGNFITGPTGSLYSVGKAVYDAPGKIMGPNTGVTMNADGSYNIITDPTYGTNAGLRTIYERVSQNSWSDLRNGTTTNSEGLKQGITNSFDQNKTSEQNNAAPITQSPEELQIKKKAEAEAAANKLQATPTPLKSGMKNSDKSTNKNTPKKVSFNMDNNQTFLIPDRIEVKNANKEIQDENNQQDAITRSQSQTSLSLNEQLSQAQEELAIITDQIENKDDSRDHDTLLSDQEAKADDINNIIDKKLQDQNITPDEKIILLQEKIKMIDIKLPSWREGGDMYKKLTIEKNTTNEKIAALQKGIETAQALPTSISKDNLINQEIFTKTVTQAA